mmetsp:Transcript_3431/g.10092  ORF Transcript_3431/g.10092 Transcript_3431/m.10092 type:complete len:269 (+) Transcript_3431:1283-2089(+)
MPHELRLLRLVVRGLGDVVQAGRPARRGVPPSRASREPRGEAPEQPEPPSSTSRLTLSSEARGRSKTCAWVARFRNRCAALGDNGRFAAEECRFSCATCDRPAEAACIEANFGTVITESCGDSDAWHKKNDESKDCAWVAANADRCTVKADGAVYRAEWTLRVAIPSTRLPRRASGRPKELVPSATALLRYAFEECKATCGTCGKRCVDDPTWHKAGEPLKTCAWAARFRNRCAATGEDGVTGFNACRRACRSCDYERERAAVAVCED